MKKWIAIVLLIIIGVIGYNYVYQDHRDVSTELPEYDLKANAIKTEFVNDMKASEEKYLNRTIVVSGQISDTDNTGITLDSDVFCQFADAFDTPSEAGSTIKIKGRVIGYDDLLGQVKLDQCTVIKH